MGVLRKYSGIVPGCPLHSFQFRVAILKQLSIKLKNLNLCFLGCCYMPFMLNHVIGNIKFIVPWPKVFKQLSALEPFPTNVTLQPYHYSHGKCSKGYHSLVPPAQSQDSLCYDHKIEPLSFPTYLFGNSSSKDSSQELLLCGADTCNTLINATIFTSFKSRVNHCLSTISSQSSHFHSSSYVHITHTTFRNCLPSVVLRHCIG